jgi:arylsulfate sulfotransferase
MANSATTKQWILAIISFFVLSGIGISGFLMRVDTRISVAGNQGQAAAFVSIMSDTIKQVKFQEEVEKNLLAELKSGVYSFDKPLVVVDPYNQSPLTAVLLFVSAEPLNISVHVEGKDNLSDIDFTFEGYNTEHIIPIYGLYPNKVNKVTLTCKDNNGKTSRVVLKIETQPLPKDLSDIIILTDLPWRDAYQAGLNFSYEINGNTAAFDAHGEYRWYLRDKYLLSCNYHFNNRFIVAKGEALKGDVLFYEINPLGRIFRILYSPYGLHHDIEVFKDNNLLVTGCDGETVEDFIYEINTQTGKVENMLDLKTVLQRSRKGLETLDNPDWFHNNAITWVKNEDAIIISGRNQSTVAKLSWPSGKIDWILSAHDNWLPMFEKYLLTAIGPSFEWQYNQHEPEVLPDYDNDPDTIDILLFDNGNQRFRDDKELQRAIKNNEVIEPDLYSRIVHYRINEKDKTVEQIWQYGKEMGKILYSSARGDADLLANGNRLALFFVEADTSASANYMEVSANSEIVWQAQAISKKASGSLLEYKAERMSIYSTDANNLQIGTPVINLIPDEILSKYGKY